MPADRRYTTDGRAPRDHGSAQSADLEPAADERPSKSARKRAAHAAQALGERLIALKDADLVRLQLPEDLLEAVRAARRIRARGGLARQKQYIGKLMRDLDPVPIAAALDALR
jgi:ribosome-associated protein